ncbi:MAG: PD40 domain-containing protein [Anaerolineales bacterium]|nr:PD40 domain-containing protein [Anaerolineales bacterium]
MCPKACRAWGRSAASKWPHRVAFSDRNIDLSQFGSNGTEFVPYDDTDPAWLPDGRIVFSSTRFPGFGMYGAARSSNLFVINANGTGLHRITGEHFSSSQRWLHSKGWLTGGEPIWASQRGRGAGRHLQHQSQFLAAGRYQSRWQVRLYSGGHGASGQRHQRPTSQHRHNRQLCGSDGAGGED